MICRRKFSVLLFSLAASLWLFLDSSIVHASSKIGAAIAQLRMVEGFLEAFRNDVGRYPTSEEGLDALHRKPPQAANWKGPYMRTEAPYDPWGQPYVYYCPAKFGPKAYDLYSYGSNHTDDHGDRDDVTNWKEINHEYYGGLSKNVRLLLNLSAAIVSIAISMGLFRRWHNKTPSTISSRFAVSSALCMVILIIWVSFGLDHIQVLQPFWESLLLKA